METLKRRGLLKLLAAAGAAAMCGLKAADTMAAPLADQAVAGAAPLDAAKEAREATEASLETNQYYFVRRRRWRRRRVYYYRRPRRYVRFYRVRRYRRYRRW